MSQAASLCVESIDVSYGPLQVLFGVSLDVPAGDVLTVLGTNGAGKSTLLRAVAGLIPARGRVLMDDVDVSAWDTEARVRNGLVLVEGGRAVFPSLTVEENLRAGGFSFGRNSHLLQQRSEEMLELFPALRARWSQKAGRLSGGERQMLALAKGLILDARVLCIDELSLGLAPVVVDELLEVIRGLRSRHVTIVLVEQSVKSALAVADHAVFLEKGQIRFAGSAQELADGDLLHAAFMGGIA